MNEDEKGIRGRARDSHKGVLEVDCFLTGRIEDVRANLRYLQERAGAGSY